MSSPLAAFPPPFPTADELAHLTSLVPSSSPSSTSFSPALLSVLAEVLAPCRLPAILDFLLNPNVNPLSVLTSPMNRNAACCSDVTITAVQRPSAPTSPTMDTHFNGIYAFIPAFNIDHTQLGFGVRQCNVQCKGNNLFPPCAWPPQPSIFRFLRNDSTNVLLIVQDHVDPVVKFDYMRLINSATRRRHFVAFSRPALQALYRSHSTFEPSHVAPHVLVYNSCTDRRLCTLCANPPSAPPCFCPVNLPKPMHAFDFDVTQPAMAAHLGNYEGLSSMTVCTQGINLHSALMGSRMTITAHVDNDLIHRLTRWAITDELSKSPDNPLKDMLLSSSPVCTPSTSSHESTTTGDRSSPPTTISAHVSPAQLPTSSQMSAVWHALREPQLSTISTVHDDKLPNNNSLSHPYQTHNITDLTSEPLQPNNDTLTIPDPMQDVDQWSGNLFQLPVPPSTTDNFEDAPLHHPPASDDPGEELPLTTLLVDDAATASVRNNPVALPDAVVPRSKAVNIAPAGGIVPLVDAKSKEQEQKERKAEKRRQRNREAAQRSNMKRKMKNDTLKAELKKWHGKASDLRNKELGLREENLRLRKMLAGG